MKEYTVKEYEFDDYKAAKDAMTKDDIVDILEYIKRGYIPDYNYTGSEDDFERYKMHVAISKAIEAIKEQ